MIDERKEEIAALYALGVLEPHEAKAFESEMRADDELRRFVDEMTKNSAALAHAVPHKAAPSHLREKVLSRIQSEKADAAAEVEPEKIVAFERPFPWFPWAVAACLAVMCSVFFTDRVKMKNQIADLANKNDVCQMQVAMLDSMSAESQKGVAVVIWDPSTQTGVLNGEDMPRPAANQDYQLWVVDPKYDKPVNAGVFSVDEKGQAKATFKPDQPVGASGKFAVSIEKKGGVEQHQGPIVMLSK